MALFKDADDVPRAGLAMHDALDAFNADREPHHSMKQDDSSSQAQKLMVDESRKVRGAPWMRYPMVVPAQ